MLINEAIEKQQSQSAAPRVAALFHQRGRLHLWAGQQQQACADFASTVALNEFLPRAWFQMGRCWIGVREYPRAAAALERALSLDPRLQEAAAPLVAVLAALGREDDAERVMLHHDLE